MHHPIAQRVLSQLEGKPAWLAKKGHGSSLTFEFGEPSLYIREPREASPDASEGVKALYRRRLVKPRGEWHLWIDCCHWNILQDGQRLSHDESPDEVIESAVRELDGQCLIDLTIGRDASCVFQFDLGGTLKTVPYGDDEDDDQWLLYEPTGMVLSIQSGGTYQHAPGNNHPGPEASLPLFDGTE